jgi:hypothetical protein
MITERVRMAIETDEQDPKVSDQNVRNIYDAATPDQKAVIDRVFISICGWRLKTLLEEKKR